MNSFSDKQWNRLLDAFSEIKAERDSYLTEKTFVKTNEYSTALRPGKSVIVGRRGAGKSALLVGNKTLNNRDYYLIEQISLKELNFEGLYNLFYKNIKNEMENFQEDFIKFEDISHPVSFCQYAWKNSLMVLAILLLDEENKKSIKSVSEHKFPGEKLNKYANLFRSKLCLPVEESLKGRVQETLNGLMGYFFELAQETIGDYDPLGIAIKISSAQLFGMTCPQS